MTLEVKLWRILEQNQQNNYTDSGRGKFGLVNRYSLVTPVTRSSTELGKFSCSFSKAMSPSLLNEIN